MSHSTPCANQLAYLYGEFALRIAGVYPFRLRASADVDDQAFATRRRQSVLEVYVRRDTI